MQQISIFAPNRSNLNEYSEDTVVRFDSTAFREEGKGPPEVSGGPNLARTGSIDRDL